MTRVRVLMAVVLITAIVTACSERKNTAAAPQPARRIVSLAPNLTELVYAIGAGERLVGVSAWSDYPREVLELPVIGDAFTVDQEQLKMLAPDLLLVWESGTPAHIVDELRAVGYNVTTIRTRGLDDIATAMLTLGELTGYRDGAAKAASDFRLQVQALRDRYQEESAIRVFYQVSARPLYTVNGEHYVSELISICGGNNIFGDLNALAPMVDVEAVVDRDPEVMLASTDAGDDAFIEWERWPAIGAIHYGNQFLLPADEIGRATARLIIAGNAMCIALQQARMNRDQASVE